MNILALDTATEACSAALLSGPAVHERHEVAPRRHAELILPMVDAVLADAGLKLNDLDAIAFGRGPGAFTGVRIAAAVTQGLATGAGLPVLPVSSLAALAQGALNNAAAARLAGPPTAPGPALPHTTPGQDTIVLAAIDARMGEIYWSLYEPDADGLATPLAAEQVTAPAALKAPGDRQIFAIGSGWKTYCEPLQRILSERVTGADPERLPLAKDLLPLAAREYHAGRSVNAEQALPVYLRDKVVSG